MEEFEEILGCPLGGRKPYLYSGFYPSMVRIAKVVKISAQELDRVKQNRNGVVGIPRKHLGEKAKALVDQGEWASLIDVLALLVFGVILFPNMDGLVDLMQSYPARALDRRLQEDWARDGREDPRVLMSLRVYFERMG